MSKKVIYRCVRKCYFRHRIYRVGQTLIDTLDAKIPPYFEIERGVDMAGVEEEEQKLVAAASKENGEPNTLKAIADKVEEEVEKEEIRLGLRKPKSKK